jgi:transaldolase
VRCHKGKTKIIAASVRNREEAIALAGCDFLLLNERVIAALNEKPSADKVRTIHWFPYDRFRVVNADP